MLLILEPIVDVLEVVNAKSKVLFKEVFYEYLALIFKHVDIDSPIQVKMRLHLVLKASCNFWLLLFCMFTLVMHLEQTECRQSLQV